MKHMFNINRSGKIPPQPDAPALPSLPVIPEIQFSPNAPLVTHFKAYLIEETDYGGLMAVTPTEAFSRTGSGGFLIFLCVADDKFPECKSVRMVARVVGMSKPGKTPDGVTARSVYYQELLRPGQSPQHLFYSLDDCLHNVIIEENINALKERIVFRPSYDRQSLMSTGNVSENVVRWYYNGRDASSPLRCDISTTEGASISNYTVSCLRLPITMLSTEYIDQPGTGSLVAGSLSARDSKDIYNYPALMFSLVAITNYSFSNTAGNELQWLVFEKKNSQRNLVTMMFKQTLDQLLVTNKVQSSEMLLLSCAASFID